MLPPKTTTPGTGVISTGREISRHRIQRTFEKANFSPLTFHLITISVMTCAFTWSFSLFTSDLRLMSNS